MIRQTANQDRLQDGSGSQAWPRAAPPRPSLRLGLRALRCAPQRTTSGGTSVRVRISLEFSLTGLTSRLGDGPRLGTRRRSPGKSTGIPLWGRGLVWRRQERIGGAERRWALGEWRRGRDGGTDRVACHGRRGGRGVLLLERLPARRAEQLVRTTRCPAADKRQARVASILSALKRTARQCLGGCGSVGRPRSPRRLRSLVA